MNEVGWCYLEGFGTKKDKVSSKLFLTSGPASHASTPLPPSSFHPILPGLGLA